MPGAPLPSSAASEDEERLLLVGGAKRLHTFRKVAFAMGAAPNSLTHTIVGFFLSPFLLEVALVPPADVGNIVLIGRFFDAFTDPMMGYLAQRFLTRWGRFRPWMFFSAIPCVATYFGLWVVPDWGRWEQFAYYLIVYCLFQLAFTCYFVPYTSLTMEVSPLASDRDSATAFRMTAEILSVISAVVIQGQIVQSSTFADNPKFAYILSGIVISCLSAVMAYICIFSVKEYTTEERLAARKRREDEEREGLGYKVHSRTSAKATGNSDRRGLLSAEQQAGADDDDESAGLSGKHASYGTGSSSSSSSQAGADANVGGSYANGGGAAVDGGAAANSDRNHQQQVAVAADAPEHISLWEGVKLSFKSRSYLILMFMYMSVWLAVQMVQGNLVLYIKYAIKMQSQFDMIIVSSLLATFCMIPVWTAVIKRIGKRRTYLIGQSIHVPVLLLFYFMDETVWHMYCTVILIAIGTSVAYLLPWSMLPDTIDEAQVLTGVRRESVFYAFFVFFQKFTSGIALSLSSYALELVGYVSKADDQPDKVKETLRLLVSVVPACLCALGLFCCWLYPISSERAAANRAMINQMEKDKKAFQDKASVQGQSSPLEPASPSMRQQDSVTSNVVYSDESTA
ncbi:hypothetical protein CAOG_01073 [Capsaspora owczarzaki ATCC 30864]|uniref:Uncharacterized protein n=1 Tax=Capsaspora owczarzaki (strain ATCC 30864) TaxID=595528 RepID=A0A0D2VI81_CAPO3|nr:hypothetical protein CAOG_01073 [Capsaspora owczarzaki ATCC 30864]KJE89637.1 hypothetical protein CAOG_001073 [Capsaspora owczarzaki ATCC 30864]|eukprot:XP_004365944.2 hypothetical protein CAOG_01073 [Capsaspora owczarzaki ATCC 30864]